VALDADDLARLGRIESDLASADPDLARRLRSWRPSAGQDAALPGWSVPPRWVLEVFLVGFACWVLPPALSFIVVAGVASWRLWERAAARRRPASRGVTRGPGRRRPRR
jgi:hypothetical protein